MYYLFKRENRLNKILKLGAIVFVSCFLYILLSVQLTSSAVIENNPADLRGASQREELLKGRGASAAEYAPGQLIVKLKEGESLGVLQGLNAKYKVSSQEKAFKDIPSPEATLSQLKAKDRKSVV